MTNIQQWITPENISLLIAGIGWLYTHIKKVQAQKGNTVIQKSKMIAYEACKDVSNYLDSNENKKEAVFKTLYNSLPAKERKYLSEGTARILISGVYQEWLKPELQKQAPESDKIDMSLDSSGDINNSEGQ